MVDSLTDTGVKAVLYAEERSGAVADPYAEEGRRQGADALASFMAIAGGVLPYLPPGGRRAMRCLFPRDERPVRKCLLPGCEATTAHAGGYCCADHCREHRTWQRGRAEWRREQGAS